MPHKIGPSSSESGSLVDFRPFRWQRPAARLYFVIGDTFFISNQKFMGERRIFFARLTLTVAVVVAMEAMRRYPLFL